MPAREPNSKTQIDRIKKRRIRQRSSGGRKTTLWSRRAPGGTIKGSRGTNGRFVVRKKLPAGVPAPAVVGGPREASLPRGGIFSLGDPTLAKRVEEELNHLDR